MREGATYFSGTHGRIDPAALEEAAEAIVVACGSGMLAGHSHVLAERLRQAHGFTVTIEPLDGVLRRVDQSPPRLALAESLPPSSRAFQMAFQLALMEAKDAAAACSKAAATLTEALGKRTEPDELEALALGVSAVAPYLGLGEAGHAGEEEMLEPALKAAREQADRVADQIAQLPCLTPKELAQVFARVAERQRHVGYDGSVERWIEKMTPPDLE